MLKEITLSVPLLLHFYTYVFIYQEYSGTIKGSPKMGGTLANLSLFWIFFYRHSIIFYIFLSLGIFLQCSIPGPPPRPGVRSEL